MLDANPLDDLPTRLEQVLRLLAAGKRNKEIAQELGYSTNTIRNYVSELLELSSCRSRTELAVRASESENVKYSPDIYGPTGFNTSATYEHWDVIYGGRNEGWIAYIGIGQVYGEPYRMYPFQEYYWSWQPDPQVRPHWSALSSHHGVVLH